MTEHIGRGQNAVPFIVGGVRRVLVAFDGSEDAWTALQLGIDVAVANRALLTVAAVTDEPLWSLMALSPFMLPCSYESLRDDAEAEMRRHLAVARDAVPPAVSLTTQLLRGRAAQALADIAAAGDYDLVLAGAARRGRAGLLLHGRVALITRPAPSVLAVKAGECRFAQRWSSRVAFKGALRASRRKDRAQRAPARPPEQPARAWSERC